MIVQNYCTIENIDCADIFAVYYHI